MSKHYTITIKAAYDGATVPEGLDRMIEDNIDRCIGDGMLCDTHGESIIDEFSVEVDEHDCAHEPDWETIQRADCKPPDGIVDVWCKHCGVSGSTAILPAEINW